MSNRIDLTGQRFGRLTVIEYAYTKNRIVYWKCICDCGNEKIIRAHNLRKGDTRSCGCYAKEKFKEMSKKYIMKHNKKHTRIYRIWENMVCRCYNKNRKCYKNYGGRGIKVCDEWRNDFMSFYNWSMTNGYKDDLTIDRININGNYEPSNCRWATIIEQANNKRNNKVFFLNGKRYTLAELGREYNINYKLLHSRVFRYKWSIYRALGINNNGNKS